MQLLELIQMADEGYPDSEIMKAWDKGKNAPKMGNTGDTLAMFITRELNDTFDPAANDIVQLIEVIRVLDMADRDLTSVKRRFTQALAEKAAACKTKRKSS